MKEFITADAYLIAVLWMLLQQEPLYRVKNNRTLGVFSGSDDLYRALNDYNNGIALNALEFVEKIKRVRGELLARRNRGNEGAGE